MLLLALILTGLFLFFALFVVYFVADGFFGGLDFASNSEVVDKVVQILVQRHLEKGEFYDLGSSRGGFASRIARAFPKMNVRGFDDSRFRTLIAKIRSLFLKNVGFVKKNIFDLNISSADAVYVYLPQELMPKLQIKLQNELKPGAIVITNKVSFPDWLAINQINQLFVYQKA